MTIRYSCQHSHFSDLWLSFRRPIGDTENAPLPHTVCACRFGDDVEPRYIVGAVQLAQCARTRSSKDGCFQAHLLDVNAAQLPCPLTSCFGTLADNLGCFPFDYEPLHS